jgi:hypothetical protein
MLARPICVLRTRVFPVGGGDGSGAVVGVGVGADDTNGAVYAPMLEPTAMSSSTMAPTTTVPATPMMPKVSVASVPDAVVAGCAQSGDDCVFTGGDIIGTLDEGECCHFPPAPARSSLVSFCGDVHPRGDASGAPRRTRRWADSAYFCAIPNRREMKRAGFHTQDLWWTRGELRESKRDFAESKRVLRVDLAVHGAQVSPARPAEHAAQPLTQPAPAAVQLRVTRRGNRHQVLPSAWPSEQPSGWGQRTASQDQEPPLAQPSSQL